MRKRSEYKGGDNRRKPSKERRVTVGESNTLLPFLFELLKEQSRSSVKGLLSRGQISVNGKVTRQFDAPLNPNDTVGINYGRGKVEFNNPLLRIVWEDDDLIVINKREGLLSVSTDRIKERTAYRIPVSYTHLDVYKRQICISNTRVWYFFKSATGSQPFRKSCPTSRHIPIRGSKSFVCSQTSVASGYVLISGTCKWLA